MHAQRGRNYTFFDAPVGLIFTIERRLNTGSWMDIGMFLQNVMLAARAQGLHTCPQAAFANYHSVIRRHLPIRDEEIVVCGMAMGYRNPEAPENIWRTDRAPVSSFTRWIGF
jgi:nitroreductase